jgi:hypothetical protein
MENTFSPIVTRKITKNSPKVNTESVNSTMEIFGFNFFEAVSFIEEPREEKKETTIEELYEFFGGAK